MLSSPIMITIMPACFFSLSFLFCFVHLLHAVQQSYPPTEYTMDCNRYHADNAGYLCEPTTPTCETLAYFHVQEGHYSDLYAIATQLFSTTPSSITEASGLPSSGAKLNPDEGIYVPFRCTCNGNFTSHNITYSIQPGDTFAQVANVTFEGLTTCQAIQYANPNTSVTNLHIGDRLIFPLRCACPSQEQKRGGINFLVTYAVGRYRESIPSVVTMFGISEQEFLATNNILNSSIKLFPASTVLLPFSEKPTRPPNGSSMHIFAPTIRSKKSYVVVAIAVGGGLLVLTLMAIGAACFAKKTEQCRSLCNKKLLPSTDKSPCEAIRQPEFALNNDKLKQNLLEGMSDLIYEKLASYSLDEIKQATQNFHPTKNIKGAVYRGTLKGQVVAVKGMTRDVSKELQILKKVNHTNLVSLLGVCIASPEQTYLVYEFAENGSLHDWLHGNACSSMSSSDSAAYTLTCRNRLQIALDVATAMQYIHDHTYPSFVHKDINTHNILLDARMRGKIANFAMAKRMEGVEPATRHIVGTRGYMAPEYVAHGMVSQKMDVYAYGVVLLEMLSGEKAMRGEKGSVSSITEEIGPLLSGPDARERLREWIDPCVNGAFPLDCAYSLAILARSCVAEDPSVRPNAREVAFSLSKLLEMYFELEPSSFSGNYTHNINIEAR